MPQLIPFYFMNQLTYGLLLITVLLILFSQFFLPMILRLYVSRLFISKL
ncbi:ATP synthase F0 subunit 8 (mitochondrion) [Nakaseomyces glabratus]|uniref:ATP synthase protein 8 n=5 Tax=Nakaseomyces TaxID=374468 RepID=ATP8_CANGA|nr:ATP synthase subunit 8 [Nakaseomyces glabratus CBS 138]YP_002836196.1 ATP synthase subunit 8 [Nakaseomyces delphensis]YP_009444509.1 ATP synthase F0 subunit 8 [Nakaseomyces nivariensis]YP_009444524.1 ATP synthase F0 subunit 8 [Nakaseomyces bracarensis]P05040.1 RecName: Full=ATP synthase protein 8; AltName: Full=A6L; AltName: Full=F-ATPase subunit 8 [Nakaseomyces glabratus CBS 138]OXB40192.1 ATP synthase F0 subunit 8 [Nakaseomyces glabratus]APD15132.1 ATP synthase F0 subunit 8 [Nakaseomyces|eukprot:NP_818782.1 ATP synthase subunit 8 (mitochondrion) [Candida glabrata CBS 138]